MATSKFQDQNFYHSKAPSVPHRPSQNSFMGEAVARQLLNQSYQASGVIFLVGGCQLSMTTNFNAMPAETYDGRRWRFVSSASLTFGPPDHDHGDEYLLDDAWRTN